MNLTPTQRSITEYHLTLSEQDALEAVTSPLALGEKIAAQLRAAGISPVGGGRNGQPRKPKPSKPAQPARRPKARAGARAQRPAAHEKGGSLERVLCPQNCGKRIARKYLTLHLSKMHPSAPQPAASASDA